MGEQENIDNVSQFLKESQDQIFINNKKWVDSKVSADGDFFAKLSSGQKPDYLYEVSLPYSNIAFNQLLD